MEGLTTTTIVPAPLKQFFDKYLLSRPLPGVPKSKFLIRLFEEIEKDTYRMRDLPQKQERYALLKAEFMEIYEQITKKEEEFEGKTGNPSKGLFYHYSGIDKRFKRLFELLAKRKGQPS